MLFATHTTRHQCWVNDRAVSPTYCNSNRCTTRAIGCTEQREAHRLYNDAPPSVGTSYALKLFYAKLRLFILIAF